LLRLGRKLLRVHDGGDPCIPTVTRKAPLLSRELQEASFKGRPDDAPKRLDRIDRCSDMFVSVDRKIGDVISGFIDEENGDPLDVR
jgi:hypothetical protein